MASERTAAANVFASCSDACSRNRSTPQNVSHVHLNPSKGTCSFARPLDDAERLSDEIGLPTRDAPLKLGVADVGMRVMDDQKGLHSGPLLSESQPKEANDPVQEQRFVARKLGGGDSKASERPALMLTGSRVCLYRGALE